MLWPERRGGAADLAGAPVQTGRDVAESHREDAAGRKHRCKQAGEDSRDTAKKRPAILLKSLLEIVSLSKILRHIVLIALANLCGEEMRSGDYLVPLLSPKCEGSAGRQLA